MRLIGEARFVRHVGQGPATAHPLPGKLEPAPDQIAVRTRSEHQPELAGHLVSRHPCDRLQLRGMHDTGPLRVEELSSALDGWTVDDMINPDDISLITGK